MIETIFFDIGGVLLDIHPERTLDYLHDCTGLPRSVLEEAFTENIHDLYERGILNDIEFFRNYRDSLPQPNGLVQDEFFSAWLALLGEPTETLTLARHLTLKYPVWLASNTNSYHIQHGPITDQFDFFTGCIYSFEIGARKPDREFFRRALEITGAQASSSLFIDDRLDNVKVAKAMGFKAVCYVSDTQLQQDLGRLLPEV